MPALSVPADSGLHGDRLAGHFGITATSALSIRRPGMAAVAMSRLRGSVGPGQSTNQLRAEAAFSIVVQLRGLDHHELGLGKRLVHLGPVPAGAVSAIRGPAALQHERRVRCPAALHPALCHAAVPPSCTTWISSKLCVGRAPRQHRPLAASFLSEQRIEKARNLLLNTALPLAEIGLPCGFGDHSHCTRVFTRLGGVGHGQWRRLYRVPPAPPVDDR